MPPTVAAHSIWKDEMFTDGVFTIYVSDMDRSVKSTAIGLYLNEPMRAAVDKLRGKGMTFQGPVIDDKALSLAFFTDPDGTPLYLAEMKPAYR